MAGFKVNAKAAAGRARKEETNQQKLAKKAEWEEEWEAESWKDGAKSSKKAEEQEEKRLAALRAKQEREAMLAEEEAGLKSKPRGEAKKAAKKAVGNLDFDNVVESFAATNLDDALDLMSALNSNSSQADKIERHPERRVKSAWAAFEEDELPKLKKEFPTLKHSQLHQKLQKMWKKSERNPLNQSSVAFNASKEEIQGQLEQGKSEVLERLRE